MKTETQITTGQDGGTHAPQPPLRATIHMPAGARELAAELAARVGAASPEAALVGAVQAGLLTLEHAPPAAFLTLDAVDAEAFEVEATAEQLQRAECLAEPHRAAGWHVPAAVVLAAAAQAGLERLTRPPQPGPFRIGEGLIGATGLGS